MKQQIEIYQSDIIICCGTNADFFDFLYENTENKWSRTTRGIDFRDDGKTILISFSHPASRTRYSFLYYALLDAVKEILARR